MHLEKIISMGKEVNFLSGTYPIRQGEKNENLYYIISGLVRGVYLNQEGNEKTKCFCAENEWFGTESFLYKCEPTYNVECLEDTRCICVNYETVHKWMKESAENNEYVISLLVKAYRKQEERSKDLLASDAKERYQSFISRFEKILPRVKQKYIASYIGINPVSLSRILNSN